LEQYFCLSSTSQDLRLAINHSWSELSHSLTSLEGNTLFSNTTQFRDSESTIINRYEVNLSTSLFSVVSNASVTGVVHPFLSDLLCEILFSTLNEMKNITKIVSNLA
jgi:hypothetical protein